MQVSGDYLESNASHFRMEFSYYQTESFNVKPRYDCIETKNNARIPSKYNNEANCTANGGQWLPVYSYLEKATSKNTFILKRFSFNLFMLDYQSQQACEAASNGRYQYKWARKNRLNE